MLDAFIVDYANDSENPIKNYKVGLEYERLGHTAAAISYFLRAAERTDNDDLSYECLIRIGFCFERQRNRNYTVKSMFYAAMSLIPERPEAYYHLSRMLESEKQHFEAYSMAEVGLTISKTDFNNLNIDYGGRGYLLFQKAVNAWWRGRCMEARKIFQDILNNHWSELDDKHKNLVENNITSLGSGPYSYAFKMYKDDMYDKLRYKFPGSDKIKNNYSQVYQDLFILSLLNGKRNGSFLEIGGADPWMGNNTALLETEFDWTGVSIEYDKKFIDNYKVNRPKTKVLHHDALTVDYTKVLSENYGDSKIIDYLQLDIEPAKNTYECMMKIPFDDFKFRVITYEHDYYADITRSYRDKSREYLKSKGYVLVVNDISPDGICNFEDWWVHPELIDIDILNSMIDTDEKTKSATDYMFPDKPIKIEHMSEMKDYNIYNSNMRKTSWIVDSFYSEPEKIRKFALEQNYLEGGLGRGFIGRRTQQQFLFPGLKEKFQDIMGKTITKWEDYGMNGRFQIAWSGEPLVYHCDSQRWGGMLYLTPGAPYQCGTTLYANKQTRARTYYDQGWDAAWTNVPGDCHLDGTPFESVDVLGNVYNRLVIFDASCIHSASQYFGTVKTNARLWQMFFFDTE
jgi:tetratricopeptide (TPR) repeat protein